MRFNLDLKPTDPGFTLDHSQELLLTGSCFSDNIGEKLSDHGFRVLFNPAGIAYNPLSMAAHIEQALSETPPGEDSFLERSGLAYSYHHHSSIKGSGRKELSEAIAAVSGVISEKLKTASCIIFTFGTAFVYEHVKKNIIVANCHKQPADEFTKRLLSTTEIVNRYTSLAKKIRSVNRDIKIVFTVSPVKHLRDGVINNNISKSVLLLAVNDLVKAIPHSYYFPAYELVNDDLRDYRFYKEDLAHPNELAVDYVWQKFSGTFFSQSTNAVATEFQKLVNALRHKPIHNSEVETIRLGEYIAKQKLRLLEMCPGLQFHPLLKNS